MSQFVFEDTIECLFLREIHVFTCSLSYNTDTIQNSACILYVMIKMANCCFHSFLLLWSAVLIMYPTTLAVIALTFSNYVLQPAFPNCLPPYIATRLLSTACVCE